MGARHSNRNSDMGGGMAIAVVTCHCGSTEQVARNFLEKNGYPGWMSIKVHKGKEESRRVAKSLAGFPEAQMLDNYLQNVSKWVVIIGWNENGCRWTDLTHNPSKASVEGQLIIETFA